MSRCNLQVVRKPSGVCTQQRTFDVVRFVEKGPGGLRELTQVGMTGILFTYGFNLTHSTLIHLRETPIHDKSIAHEQIPSSVQDHFSL